MKHAAATRPAPFGNWWRAIALALVVYAASLVISAPATFLAWALATGTNNVLILELPRGGLWRGDADALVVSDQSRGVQRFETLRWEFLASGLFRGELAARMQIEDPNLRGSVDASVWQHGVRFSAVEVASPVSTLAAYYPALTLGKLSGSLTLRTADFVLERNRIAGDATLTWRDADSTLSNVHPLGEYVAHVTGTGQRVELRIETVSGALRVEGKGAWSRDAGGSFDGAASAVPEHRVQLAELLRVLDPSLRGATYRIAPFGG